MRALPILLIALGIPHPVETVRGFMTAGQLEALCQASPLDPMMSRDACLSYLAGSIDQLYAQGADRDPEWDFCLPKDAMLERTRSAFLRYLDAVGDERNGPASVTIQRALSLGYPCKARPKLQAPGG